MKNRKLLMIPGPIEFEPAVLRAMGEVTTSHVAENFINTFQHALQLMREVWLAPTGQPFIVAGSGTLAMDMAAANLIEKGDSALVISTGYFGNRFKDILERYGAHVTFLEATLGNVVPLELIEKELQSKQYKLVTITHVDTSTGVLVHPAPIVEIAKKYNVLTILDGVCSVAGEVIKQEEWGIDVVLTASQKAIGVPPGLALLVVSSNAMNVWKNRTSPVQNYYADWSNWLPIMRAYETGKPSYFGTPPVNLIRALEVSLEIIVKEGIRQRVAKHKKLATAFRKSLQSIGLQLVPTNDDSAANTLSAIYYPKNIDGASFLKKVYENDVILAGGLLASIKNNYFRVGHMGAISSNDLLSVLSGIEKALHELSYPFEIGKSLSTFQEEML